MAALVHDVRLISNGFALATSPDRLGRLVPTDPAQPRAELWEQYQAQGYHWLKGILDRQEVLGFRRRFFAAFVEAGLPLIVPGTHPVDGIFDDTGMATDPGRYRNVVMEIVRWAEYEAFSLATPLRRFYEMLLEG